MTNLISSRFPFWIRVLLALSGTALWIYMLNFIQYEDSEIKFSYLEDNSVLGSVLVAFVFFAINLILGAPLRLIPKLRDWWFSHRMLALTIVIIGLIAGVVSCHPSLTSTLSYRMDGMDMQSITQNVILYRLSVGLVCFGFLHWNYRKTA